MKSILRVALAVLSWPGSSFRVRRRRRGEGRPEEVKGSWSASATPAWGTPGASSWWRTSTPRCQAPRDREDLHHQRRREARKQLADIDDLLVKKVDALIVYPTVADAIIPAIEKVYEKGIPVIVFGGNIATEKLTSLVMQDLTEFGRSRRSGWPRS